MHGLIQHSFALRLAKGHRPFAGPETRRGIEERFALPAVDDVSFDIRSVCESHDPGSAGEGTAGFAAEHSPLVERGMTTVRPLPISLPDRFPPAFEWAQTGAGRVNERRNEPRLIFAEDRRGADEGECNDFLVERSAADLRGAAVSWTLLEILAHKRSRLLGLALANRVVSVMLPYALLTLLDEDDRVDLSAGTDRSWFAQPLVSFIKDGRVKSEFRDSYALTLILAPVTGQDYRMREMTREEIDRVVNAGWGLATVPADATRTRFQASGPLLDYLSRLAASDASTQLPRLAGVSEREEPLTLRRCTEALAFGVSTRLAQGSRGRAGDRTRRRIGDDVVTSLGSARVSSVLVRDGITRSRIRGQKDRHLKAHRDLMTTLSRETRPPSEYGKYELDRAFVDDDTYLVGLVPTKRCLVVSCAAEAQHGITESGLTQAGSLAHMGIGAAIAIGTLRAVDRDLEEMETASPSRVARVGGEIAIDLCEIYDLDITSEAYRNLYRLLRDRLGITRDYETLQDKMAALYRAASSEHEVKTQARLVWLTAAIVALSVLILVFTVIVAGKGG